MAALRARLGVTALLAGAGKLARQLPVQLGRLAEALRAHAAACRAAEGGRDEVREVWQAAPSPASGHQALHAGRFQTTLSLMRMNAAAARLSSDWQLWAACLPGCPLLPDLAGPGALRSDC